MAIKSNFYSAQRPCRFSLFVFYLIFLMFQVGTAEAKQIRIVYNAGTAPLKFVDKGGRASGLLPDTWRLLGKKAGNEPIFIKAENFGESLDMIKNGRADMHAGLFKTPEREQYLRYSNPLFQVDYFIFSHPLLSSVNALEDLGGILVGLTKGGYTEQLLREKLPENMLRIYDTYEQLFSAAVKGEVKAFIAQEFALLYYLNTHQMVNIFQYKSQVPLYTQTYYTAVSRTHPDSKELIASINNTLGSLSQEKRRALRYKWIHTRSKQIPAEFAAILSDEERAYLSKNAIIKVQNEKDWAPFNYNEMGTPKGFSIDYLKLLGKKAGIDIRFVSGKSWDTYIEMLKSGELDLLCNIVKSPEREQFLKFTSSPYLSMAPMLYTRKGVPSVDSLEDLYGKKIAMPKGFYLTDHLKKYDKIQIIEVESSTDAVMAVSGGKADATYELMPAVNYITKKLQITNLKTGGSLDINNEGVIPSYIAARKDHPVLVGILDKAMQQVTESEISVLRSKWFFNNETGGKVNLSLTKSEQAWLGSHPNIRVGINSNRPPMNYVDEQGRARGIGVKFIKAFNRRLGNRIQIVPGTWEEISTGAKEKQIDALMDITPDAHHENFLNVTTPYVSVPHAIFARDDSQHLREIKDLNGRTLGLEKDSAIINLIAKKYPDIRVKAYDSTADILDALAKKEVDAYIGNRAVANYIIKTELISNIRRHGRIDETSSISAIGVRKDLPVLKDILQKTLDSITISERETILSSELFVQENPFFKEMTPEERSWLETHDKIRVFVGSWPPFHSMEDGEPKGLALEYVKKIFKDIGLEPEFVSTTWTDAFDNISRFRKIDLLPTIAYSEDRAESVNVTDPYLSFPFVIFTRKDAPFTGSLKDLHGRTVAVENNFIAHKRLLKDAPQINLIVVDTSKEALEAVSLGKADGYISNLAVGSFLIEKYGFTNLKVAGQTRYKSDIQSMGIRKDWPQLTSIINKYLAAMPDEVHKKIRQSALSVRYEHGIDMAKVKKFAVRIIGVFVLVVLIFIYWNRSMAKEIEKRKKIQVELTKLFQAVEHSSAVIMITDNQGTIEYVNPSFTNLTGYSPEEAMGQNPRFLKSEKTPPSLHKELWKTISSGKIWKGEIRNRIKSGREIWESASIAPVFSDTNEITHFVAVKEDITNQKKMVQEVVEAKEKAESATRAKSDFLANMSHEIRTPMNAILGMTYLALKTDLNPKQRDYINKTVASAQNLLRIINDILDFSKIEAGRLNVEIVEFDLNEVLDNLANLITIKTQEKGVELIFNQDSRVPPLLKGDPLRLGQILLNLANNAIKFTEEGEIEISIIALEIDKKEVLLKFTVRDTGIGLSREQQDHLFQPFQQADTSTTRKYGGTGLGLSICKKLCEIMGGDIGLESRPGKGATFWFTARLQLMETLKSKTIAPKSLQGLKTLIVDDNPTFCKVLKTYLEEFTFEVDIALSGRKAVDIIRSGVQSPDTMYKLVFIDWQMPGMDGIETSGQIQKETALTGVPKIIMVTGHGREDVMDKAWSMNLDGYLLKPVTHSVLFDAVMDAFGHTTPEKEKTSDRDDDLPENIDSIRGARLLLVEDNEINRQVAVELLSDEGFVVEVAEDGRKGLEKLKQSASGENFDLVFMDLQMPVMDGKTATREIRKLELHYAAQVPIVAMTADAMTGVREEVLDIGMNDYIAKPIEPGLMFEILVKWIPPGKRKLPDQYLRKSKGEKIKTEDEELPELSGIDIEAGLSRLNGNKTLYRNLLSKFHANNREAALELRQAIENNDQKLAVRMAHTVKGVAGTIGARKLEAAARELETALTADIHSDYKNIFNRFEKQLEQVLDSLGTLPPLKQAGQTNPDAEPAGTEKLLEFLKELHPHVARNKPKPVKEVLSRMDQYAWPDQVGNSIDEFKKLTGKFKFEEARIILETLIKNLGSPI